MKFWKISRITISIFTHKFIHSLLLQKKLLQQYSQNINNLKKTINIYTNYQNLINKKYSKPNQKVYNILIYSSINYLYYTKLKYYKVFT